MRALVKEVGKGFELVEIGNTLEALQSMVDGYIECVALGRLYDKGMVMIVNEEGKFTQSENVYLMNSYGNIFDVIHGTMIFLNVDGEDFTSISDENASYIARESYFMKDIGKGVPVHVLNLYD